MLIGLVFLLLGQVTNQNLLPADGFRSNVWTPADGGFVAAQQDTRRNGFAIRCSATDARSRLGAAATLSLAQQEPAPLVVTGWSKAESVSGAPDSDYAIYLDLDYSDGTHGYGLVSPFATGSHGWQQRKVLVTPPKAIKVIHIYALFRSHSGTAWFDDFKALSLSGTGVFDGQATSVAPSVQGAPKLRLASGQSLKLEVDASGHVHPQGTAGRAGGFFARDVAADGQVVPLTGTVFVSSSGAKIKGADQATHLEWTGSLTRAKNGFWIDLDVASMSNDPRALSVYFGLPVDAIGWSWGDDIRRKTTISSTRSYAGLESVSVGANGGMSRYPFACISNQTSGYVIGLSLNEPCVGRLFYDGPSQLLCICWDISLTPRKRNAHLRGWVDTLSPSEAKWGFRAAAQRLYAQFPDRFVKRVPKEGIWMPFTDSSTVSHPEDFGITFHEGDNSVASDNNLGILSFRYTEPMSYWMPMDKTEPRTYENAIRLLNHLAEAGSSEQQRNARAALSSGTKAPNGAFNMQFRNEPWCDGAMFVLDPDPNIPADSTHPSKATVNYNLADADRRYPIGVPGLSGEYLDSLESWGEAVDYSAEHMAACQYPLTFDQDRQPALPQWFSTFAFTDWLATDLHKRGKLLMANTVPDRFSILAGPADAMGIETTWISEQGEWQPDNDAIFNLRRTMAAKRPYLLLQNVDFAKFGPVQVEKYLERCAFYAVFPSMFSYNASDHPYWEDPALYNRDRPRFKQWIPVIRELATAGWEPVTYATSNDPRLYVERFGPQFLTFFNNSADSVRGTVTVDTAALGHVGRFTVVAGEPKAVRLNGSKLSVNLKPETCLVLKLLK